MPEIRPHVPTAPRRWLRGLAVLIAVAATVILGALSHGQPLADPPGAQPQHQDLPAEVSTPLARRHRLPLAAAEIDTVAAAAPWVIRGAAIPEHNWLPGHRGVDLLALPGAEVVASRGGVIRFAGAVAGNPVVSIQHDDGLVTTYEPVLPWPGISRGHPVRRGTPIGVLADWQLLPDYARRTPGLSWGALLLASPGAQRQYIDPLTLLGSTRVRLWE